MAALKQLRLNTAGTFREPAAIRAERQRQIDNSVTLRTPAFPAPARPVARLVQGRKLRA